MGKKMRLILVILLCTLVMGNEVLANNIDENNFTYEDNRANEIDLLLGEKYSFKDFEHVVKKLYPEVTLNLIDEIRLIHVELPAYVGIEDFIYNDDIEPFIEAHGKLPELSVPQSPLANIDIDKLAGTRIDQRQKRLSNEELFDTLAWHVDEITNNRKSLDISKGEGTQIAIIDSGVDINHPFLKDRINIEKSQSYVTEDSSINDCNGHGTEVAGIIGQIAPEAEMTIYRVIDAETGESEWTIEALIQAVNDGNHIINMSLGTYKCEDIESELLTIEAFERAIEYADTKGSLVVASAGNKAIDLDQYYETEHIKHLPGGIDKAITVSAINEDSIASYSNYGSNIDFCAPGGDIVYVEGLLDLNQWIYCLYPTNMDNGLSSLGVPQGYTFNCGTSLAAPAVTACFADILSYQLKNEQDVDKNSMVEIIIDGARDLGVTGRDVYYGYGVIDIYAALTSLQ